MTATTTTLGEFIARLKQDEPVPRPADEGWSAMIGRTTLFGRQLDEAESDEFSGSTGLGRSTR